MAAPASRTVSYEGLLASQLFEAEPAMVTEARVLDRLWSPEDVVAQVGDTVVPIAHITDGDYIGSDLRERTVSDYYGEITGGLPTADIPYLAELSYDRYFPTLAAQLVDPPLLKNERFSQRVMYFGSGVNSQVHFHTEGSAILFCIHGTKIVRLYAPDQTPNLYKVKGRNFSQVLVTSIGENTNEFDRSRFPDFANAEYVQYEVSAGEALFIPIYWWHSIQNLEEISLTAVYFWKQTWKDSWREFLPPYLPPRGTRTDYVRNLVSKRVLTPLRSRLRQR